MGRVTCISGFINGLWAILLLIMVAVPAMAEDKATLEEVVVTATRYNEKTADIPANITVISEKEISKSTAQNIPELLMSEVGVHVSDINGNHRTYTVDLRGFGETSALNTLVLIDGRRVNQSDLSGVDWSQLPLDQVSRIEIIRGGRGGVLYGDSATGGVINIITKEGAEGVKGGIGLEAGSYGTFKTNAHASGGTKDFSLNLNGDYLKSDGYRTNSDVEAKDAGMHAVYYLKDFLKIDFSSGYHWENDGLPGALKESDFASGASRTDSMHPDDFAKTKDYYIKLTPEVYFGEDNVFRIDTSFRKRDFQSFSSGDWGSFLGDSGIKTTSISPQVILKKNFYKTKNILTAGIDYQKTDEDIVNTSVFLGFSSVGNFTLKKENYGYYLHDEANIADVVHVSAGYRHDRANFSFSPSSPDSTSMSNDVYTAGVTYPYFKKSYVYASYSRSFRYPVIDELYSFYTNTINTALAPQTSDNYEAGLRHYITDDIYVHTSVFRLDTERELFFNPNTYQNENLDGMTRRNGVELSFNAKVTNDLTLRGSYSYLSAKIKGGLFAGKNMPDVPRQKAGMDISYNICKASTVILNGTFIGKRPFVSDFTNDFSDQKSYVLLNVKYKYHWKAFTAFVDINNITNKAYSEFGVIGGIPQEKAFYPSPRRNFLAGLSVEF